jgi:serine/threonine protein kinase
MGRNDAGSLFGDALHGGTVIGARVGGARYILKRKLGRGPWTEVWLAWDVKFEHEAALKFLATALVQHPDIAHFLEQETRRSAQLAHPSIARVYDFVCDHQMAAFATEFVDGWSLAALKIDRPQKRFSIDEISLWIGQLCGALEYAHHEFCLVHRALRPGNLLLNAREQLKVTDFGIDFLVHGLATEQKLGVHSIFSYFSPQQISGAEPSVLDDIYSLGATIYDLVTGTPPFHEGEILAQIREMPAPSMQDRLASLEIDESIPSAWEETVAACLAKKPGQRPQTALEVLRGLGKESLRKQAGVPTSLRNRPSRLEAVAREAVTSIHGFPGRMIREFKSSRPIRAIREWPPLHGFANIVKRQARAASNAVCKALSSLFRS